MNAPWTWRVVAGAVLLGAVASRASTQESPTKAPESMQLFLLIGQSNMAGRGTVEEIDRTPVPRVWMLNRDGQWVPAVEPMHFDKPKVIGVGPGRAFGVAIAEALPREEIGLIPAAVGGSPIRSWAPGATDSATHTKPYDDAIARAKIAMQSGRLAGVLWLQGEADGNAKSSADYERRMRAVIDDVRRDLGAPMVPFLIGQMGRFVEKPWNPFRARVDSAHRAVAASTPHAAFVLTEGLRHRGDTIHYDTESMREIGRRYARVYLTLREKPSASPTPGRSAPTRLAHCARPQVALSVTGSIFGANTCMMSSAVTYAAPHMMNTGR